MNDTIDNLYEELVYLCEVRGELDPESNAQIEARIAAINAEIKELRARAHAGDKTAECRNKDA